MMNEEKKEVTIEQRLQEPFEADQIEWRVQSQGQSKAKGQNEQGKVWCQVLAYVDARALQKRLDDVFGAFGWSDSYEPLGEDFICTLEAEYNGKKISKQNGASKTQVEGFKGGISNSFKRVCASGFGIGRYLYDLDVTFAETTLENKSKDSEWKRGSFKPKGGNQYITYYWRIPKLPKECLPAIEMVTMEDIEEMKKKAKEMDGKPLLTVLKRFGIARLGELTKESYNQVMTEWSKL